ncbi:MAG: Mov34/MPN/PAD-1 family protein [Nitrospirota bacterium]|nr:Mov34/MPN/PAD-1 family protein [Nitrospirota bacterium]
MLTAHTIEAISKQAVAEYPAECCGIVTGNASSQTVHPCRNRQDELHASDPEQHPRTSREAYDIDRNEMESIFRDAAAHGEQVICFYHSHIDCGAYFSQMDREVQTVFGEPEFPEAVHVVLSVQNRQVAEIRGFCWDKSAEDFTVIPIP